METSQVTNQETSHQSVSISQKQILANIREMRPLLRERSDEIEHQRRIPPDIVAVLRNAGVFRMMMPHIWGGPEMNPMEVTHALEELALGNASVAWCVMIQNDSGQYSGLLKDEMARKMYPRLDMATSNVIASLGRAQKVETGYIVNGRWPFASGCHHTDWFAGGCLVFENQADTPLLDNQGKPLSRMVLVPREKFHIHDTWYTTGLRGTGSNDVEVSDLFVPTEQTFSFNYHFDNRPRKGALYLWPSILLAKMPGVVLGMARFAIETVAAKLREKEANPGHVLLALADAEMLYRSARAYVYHSLEVLWARLESGNWPKEQERVTVALARANAFHASRKAVQLLYDALGGSAIYTAKSPLDRLLRDINTACQHVVAQRKAQQGAVELLLGQATTPFPFL